METQTQRLQGHVRVWAGPYGFLAYNDGGRARNVFVHHSAIQKAGWRELNVGDLVEFEIEEDYHGPHALRVKVLESAGASTP